MVECKNNQKNYAGRPKFKLGYFECNHLKNYIVLFLRLNIFSLEHFIFENFCFGSVCPRDKVQIARFEVKKIDKQDLGLHLLILTPNLLYLPLLVFISNYA